MKRNNAGYVVGLTGPTGAGKGEVAALLREAGVPVVDTDQLAREVVAPGQPCLVELVSAFTPQILHEDGTLNRAALAAVAFATPQATARLNAITHPHIIARTHALLDDFFGAGARVAAIDAPLLFQSGMDRLCDRTVAVLAAPAERLHRICLRDGLEEAAAKARMNAQPDDIYYRDRADEVLQNDGDLAAFSDTVRVWIARLKEGVYAK